MISQLETHRLILRPRGPEDLENCVAMDRNIEVRRYITPDFRDNFQEDNYRDMLRERLQQSYPDHLGYWTIRHREEDDRFIGIVLLLPLGETGPEIEIGWRLRQEDWRQGFATEAAQAVKQHAFSSMDLSHLVALINPENLGSLAVARKLGFEPDGRQAAWGTEFNRYKLTNIND